MAADLLVAAANVDWEVSMGCNDFIRRALWQGGSSFDAWLTASSFQIAQVLLNLPYSFAQMGIASGVTYQVMYGLMGCWSSFVMSNLYLTYKDRKQRQDLSFDYHTVQWFEVLDDLLGPWWKFAGLFFNVHVLFGATTQLIAAASTVYYLNNNLSKRAWTIAFGPCLLLTLLVPTARNYRVWATFGLVSTTFVSWYLTLAAVLHGKEPGTRHNAPTDTASYFAGASNILYAFGGHSLTIEFAAAMWKPKNYKLVYLFAVLYVYTMTLPSATAVYWAFGDKMLHNTNAFAVLPRTKFRDAAIVLMLLHQFIQLGMLMMPFFYMFEKLFGIHHSKNYCRRILVRLPICLGVWFAAIAIPFFGPVNSAIGAYFISLSVYIIPCLAHMVVHRSSLARKSAVEQPSRWMQGWLGVYCINLGVVLWVSIVGTGLGGWSSIISLSRQVSSFGFFAKCYQCPVKHA